MEHMGSIYVWGGMMEDSTRNRAALLRLDPRTRAWSTLPAMPTPTVHAGAAGVAGRMYVTGDSLAAGVAEGSLQCYDMAAGRWDKSSASMAEARDALGVAALHREVWAVGGWSHPKVMMSRPSPYYSHARHEPCHEV